MPAKRPSVTWQEQSIARQRERALARGLAEVEQANQLQRDREAMSSAMIEPLQHRNLAGVRFKNWVAARELLNVGKRSVSS